MGVSSEKHTKIADPLKVFGGNSRWTDPLGLYKPEDKSAEKAALAEAQRQQQISKAVGDINSVYDSERRQGEISKYGADLFDYFKSDLDEKQGIASRQNKFALARAGQTGGSLAADTNRLLGTQYQKGLLESNRRSQAGVSDLRAANESNRLNLISLASQGLGTTDAAQRATQAMQQALAANSASARAGDLGNVFSSTLDFAEASKKRKAENQANRQFAQQYGPFYSFGS